MINFSTVHIFGFGDAQLIGSETNGTVKSATLATLPAFVEHDKTFKPENVTVANYHVIHVFNNMEVRYLGTCKFNKEEINHFSVKLDQLDATLFSEFLTELETAVVAENATREAKKLEKAASQNEPAA
jgi:hypothetical protein